MVVFFLLIQAAVALKASLTVRELGRRGKSTASVVFESLNLRNENSLLALPRLLGANYPFIIEEQFLYRKGITEEEAELLVEAFIDEPALHPRLFPVKLVVREPALFNLLMRNPASYRPCLRLHTCLMELQWTEMRCLQGRHQADPELWEFHDKLHLPWDVFLSSVHVDDFLAEQYNPVDKARLQAIESCLQVSILGNYVIQTITTMDPIIRKVQQLCYHPFMRISTGKAQDHYESINDWMDGALADDPSRLIYWKAKLLLLVFVNPQRVKVIGLAYPCTMFRALLSNTMVYCVPKWYLQHLLETVAQTDCMAQGFVRRVSGDLFLDLHYKFPDRPYYGHDAEIALKAWKSRLAASYRPTDDWPSHIRDYKDLVDCFGRFSGPLEHHILTFETLPQEVMISGRSCERVDCFLEEAHELSAHIWSITDSGTDMRPLSYLSLEEQRSFLRLVITSILHESVAASKKLYDVVNSILRSRKTRGLWDARKIIVGSLISEYILHEMFPDPTQALLEAIDGAGSGECSLF